MNQRGILVASAALALMVGGVSCAGDAESEELKCAGINGCSGQGECGAADGSHDCGGKNSCKGKGWLKVTSAEECTEQGGTIQE